MWPGFFFGGIAPDLGHLSGSLEPNGFHTLAIRIPYAFQTSLFSAYKLGILYGAGRTKRDH